MQRARLNPAVESVSVFFPCFNDALTIPGLVDTAVGALDAAGVDGDVTVVNDGSTDASATVLAAKASEQPRLRVVTHERNRGYGGALRSGFGAATGQWVFYTDGDGQYDAAELLVLIKAAGPDVDVVQGYKTGRSDNLARRVVGRVYHHVVKLGFRLRVRDTDCDFRLIRHAVMERIELTESTGAICVELMRQLQNAGARFVEVPVSHYPRAHGRSTFFRPARIARSILSLGRLWFRLVVLRRAPAPARASSPGR